jgi:SHS2 domain-containing protein
MNQKPFELKVTGKNLKDAFEKSARMMFQELVDIEDAEFVGQYNLSLNATSPEELLQKWLNLLLVFYNKYDLVFHFFNVTIDQEKNTLTGTICGDKHTPDSFQQQKSLSQVTSTPEITIKKRSVAIEVSINT